MHYNKQIGYYSIGIFIFSFLLYANTLTHEYAYDDVSVIILNEYTQSGFSGIPDLFASSYPAVGKNKKEGTYRPLSLITFAVEHQLFPNTPFAGHLINVIFYSCCGILLFITLSQIFKTAHVFFSLSITLLFIAHPLHTEVVANIKSRDEILCFLFSMLSIYCLLQYIDHGKFSSLLISCCCYFFSLLSKESAITFVAIIPLTLYFFRNSSLKKVSLIALYYIFVSIAYLSMYFAFVENITKISNMSILDNTLFAASTFNEYWGTVVQIMGKYIGLLIFPHPLIHDYSYRQISIAELTTINSSIKCFAIIVLIVFAFIRISKKDAFSYGILFFFITLAVVSNIFFKINCTMAERFLFTPSLGFCMLSGTLMFRINRIIPQHKIINLSEKIPFVSLFIVVLVFYSFKTISRNADWKNSLTLFSADIRYASDNARAHYSLGSELFSAGNHEKNKLKRNQLYEEAISSLEKSIAIYRGYSNAYYNLGNAYAKTQSFGKAIDAYKKAILLDSSHVDAFINLGNCYNETKEYDKAILAFETSIRINPDNSSAYNNLGISHFNKGTNNLAVDAYRKAMQSDMYNSDAYLNLAFLYYGENKFDNAIDILEQLLLVDPGSYDAYFKMGIIYLAMKDTVTAHKYYQLAQEKGKQDVKEQE